MSTRREREPFIRDRLPGEQELSRLFQQTPDERPPEALDAAILAEARRAVRPRLRLLKGGKSLSQFSRRWAIPMSLAAALLVTIGVVSYLQDNVGRPVMQSQTAETRLSATAAPFAQRDEEARQGERKELDKLSSAEDAAPPKNEATRPALRAQAAKPAQLEESAQAGPAELPSASAAYRQENAPMLASPAPVMKQALQAGKKSAKAKRELSPELRQRRKSQDKELLAEKEADTRMLGMATEEAETSLMDALEFQRADVPMELEKRSPQEWLEQISELFRVGKHKEAEDSLQAFQKQHPDYTDYPDSFPEDVLERLRKR